MTTARIPFSNVGQVNKPNEKSEKLCEKIGEKSEKTDKIEKQEKIEKPSVNDITLVKNSLDDNQYEQMDKQTLIQQLKLHKMILRHCFEENEILRERVATVEAQFSNLQDEIEMRDNVILELSEKLESK